MIPNKMEAVEVNSSIEGEVGQFSVDENSLGKIMSVLTNLYSDPELAVVREYLTNALDAQIEARESDPDYVWRPIEVTTPSHFNKSYVVRDFGTGMNANDLREIYSKYGKSTKESSNSVTGMLGLGSKCALTYTGQFTITGFKNGVQTKAIVSRDENDIPVFMVVDTRATDEPNGVEINVPVRDRSSFSEKTEAFLRWWKPGQVLVNGRNHEVHGLSKLRDNPIEYVVGDQKMTGTAEIFLQDVTTSLYDRTSYIIMGGVPYAVDNEHIPGELKSAGIAFAAYVPMGAVDFPPSRERLYYNKRTKAVLTSVCEGLMEEAVRIELEKIENADTHAAAYDAYFNAPRWVNNRPEYKNVKYKGDDFVHAITHKHSRLSWDYNDRATIEEYNRIDVSVLVGWVPLIVTDVLPGTKIQPAFKKKIKHYIEENQIKTTHGFNHYGREQVVLLEKDIDSPWAQVPQRITYDQVKDIKLPSTATPRVGDAPYDYRWIDAVNGYTAYSDPTLNEAPMGADVVYVSPSDIRTTWNHKGASIREILQRLPAGTVVVELAKNRTDKFLRNHNNAVSLLQVFKDKMDTLAKSVSPMDALVGNIAYYDQEFLKKAQEKDFEDPDLKDLIKAYQNHDSSNKSPIQEAKNLVAFAKRCKISLADIDVNTNVDNPLERYPLISHAGGSEYAHLVVYVNAVYNKFHKK